MPETCAYKLLNEGKKLPYWHPLLSGNDKDIVNSGNKYLAKGVVIPPNSAIELIQGGAKIVLKNGDVLKAVSNTASSVDIVTSFINQISSQEEL